MDAEKQYDCISETSTEENDHQPEKSGDEISGGSRFYECNFCKRGFTNAQALGGHMNIHRKEKAKTKTKAKRGSISNKSQEEDYGGVIPRYYSNYSSDQTQYYAVSQQMNCQFYYPTANPSFPLASYHMISDFAAQRPDHHLGLYEDHGFPNLSPRIDSAHNEVTGASRVNSWKENDIDLELRL